MTEMYDPEFDPLDTLEQTVAQLNTNTRQIKSLVDSTLSTNQLIQSLADNNRRMGGLIEWQTREIETLKQRLHELENAVK